MERFLLAQSENPDWSDAVDECVSQLGSLPNEATLGFIYVTDMHAQHLGDILRKIKALTVLDDWVGTVGMAVCATRKEFTEQPAIVILVTDIPDKDYTIFDSPKHLPPQLKNDGVQVAVVHGDPRNGEMPNIIHKLPNDIGNGYLIGGLTSSDNYHYQIAREINEGMLSGVLFNDSVSLVTGISQGCSPIGKTHTITECDSNIVIHLDNRPALDVMKEDIGEVLARDLNRIGGYIFAGFPISGSDTGDYTVRNLMGIDTDSGALAIGEYIQAGSTMMFCKRDGSTAVTDLQKMTTKLKQRVKSGIKGGLYFSCLGRGQHMFGAQHKELELIADILGDVPLVGFYANGEIAGDQLYGYTGVLLLFL